MSTIYIFLFSSRGDDDHILSCIAGVNLFGSFYTDTPTSPVSPVQSRSGGEGGWTGETDPGRSGTYLLQE